MIWIFFKEFKKFSLLNWWIYIVFVICIFFVYKTDSWNLAEIIFIFFFHFISDLFVMMMIYYFSLNELKKWVFCQIVSFLLFFIIRIYSWIKNWVWSYLISQITFFLPSLKWFLKNFYNKNFSFLNYKLSILLWIFVVFLYYKFNLITNLWFFIQMIWFIVFPLWLMLDDRKKNYFLSMIWVWFITFWSLLLFYFWFLEKSIVWADFSHALLPLTVFIFYIKSIKKYI